VELNTEWLAAYNIHIAGYIRSNENSRIFCIFNFSDKDAYLTWYALKEKGVQEGQTMIDLWSNKKFKAGKDDEYLVLKPFQFVILK